MPPSTPLQCHRRSIVHSIPIIQRDHLRSGVGIICDSRIICGPVRGSFVVGDHLWSRDHLRRCTGPNPVLWLVYSKTRAHYNNTACLNLLFKLSWNKLFRAIFPEFHCVALSIVYTFHPTTFFQTSVFLPRGV